MGDALSREHRLRYRAERVRAALEALWGDELPDAPDPVLTVLVDAVAVDDQHGLDDRLVVQGDGLGYETLARVLADVRSPSTLQLLPPGLRARLAEVLPAGGRLIDLRASGGAAPPGQAPGDEGYEGYDAWEYGAWEYDAAAGTVAWDARTGALCGLGDRAGVAPLAEWSRRGVHDEDRALVADALRSSAATGLPCDVRFRTPPPHRGAVVVRGRVLTGADGGVRVLGFATGDVVTV